MRRSLIDFLNIAGTFIVVCIMSFAVYTLFVGKPFYESSSYEGGDVIGAGDESGTWTSNKPVDSVNVSNISGRIEVEAWSNDWVQLDYIKRGPGRHPEVVTDLSGPELRIKAEYPRAAGNFGSVDFYLKVPENLEDLKAGSVSGRITVSGLSTLTRQKLSSTSGSVSTDSSGELDISSVSGSLSFSTSGPDVSASTTSGRIEGRLTESPDWGDIRMKSVSGRLTLDVPPDINADVDLHSVSGSVSSELPVSVTSSKDHSIKGVIGSGGISIEMSTVSGSVKISD